MATTGELRGGAPGVAGYGIGSRGGRLGGTTLALAGACSCGAGAAPDAEGGACAGRGAGGIRGTGATGAGWRANVTEGDDPGRVILDVGGLSADGDTAAMGAVVPCRRCGWGRSVGFSAAASSGGVGLITSTRSCIASVRLICGKDDGTGLGPVAISSVVLGSRPSGSCL